MTSILVILVTVKGNSTTAANLKNTEYMDRSFDSLPNSVVRNDIQTALSKSLETKFSDLFPFFFFLNQMHIYHVLCSVKLRDKPEIPE